MMFLLSILTQQITPKPQAAKNGDAQPFTSRPMAPAGRANFQKRNFTTALP